MLNPQPIQKVDTGASKIGYATILTSSTDAPELLVPNTYERWRRTAADSAVAISSSAQTANYIGIAAHNLASAGVTLTVEIAPSIGGAKTSVYSQVPSSNRAIFIEFGSTTVQEVTLTVDGACEIGVLYCGEYLQMTRAIMGGHRPINYNASTNYQSNVSDTGQWLGRTITKKGTRSTYSFTLVDDSFYRNEFQPFVEAAKTSPFFIQWRPDIYPEEVAFCWTTGDIAPSNRGGATRLMEMSFSVEGYNDV